MSMMYIQSNEKVLWLIILFLFTLLVGMIAALEQRIKEIKHLRESNSNLNGLILGNKK